MARWGEATIDDRKILDYLLSPDHPVGRDKADFFTTVGYTRQEQTRLRDHLISVALSGQTVSEQTTGFGSKYVVDGVIESPSGRMIGIRTVWISDDTDSPPRLVTAYPSQREVEAMYQEHDVVVLRRDLPASGLREGDVGAVVGIYAAGGYEVEFTAADGDTVDVVTLGEGEIRPRRRREILHVREIAGAGT